MILTSCNIKKKLYTITNIDGESIKTIGEIV